MALGQGSARVELDDADEVPELVAFLAAHRVEVRGVKVFRPSLGELYRKVRHAS